MDVSFFPLLKQVYQRRHKKRHIKFQENTFMKNQFHLWRTYFLLKQKSISSKQNIHTFLNRISIKGSKTNIKLLFSSSFPKGINWMSWPKFNLFRLLFQPATSTGNRSPKQMEWIDIFTSQWLNTSCGLARPLVLFLISSAKPKLSATGRTAFIINTSVPSFISSCNTLPSLLDRTAYTRPAKT